MDIFTYFLWIDLQDEHAEYYKDAVKTFRLDSLKMSKVNTELIFYSIWVDVSEK